MREKDLNLFLQDISYNAKFKILEESADKNELENVAKAARIVWPSPDLSIFKCVYAFVSDDKEQITNKNGCRLPRAEVEKSLPTLIGKSIDLDHFRKQVVGHWIDAKIEGNKIIAYGTIFKSSFGEDFDEIKGLFSEGNLSVSFESWGQREYATDGTYDLIDQVWAGGALLIKEEPAFPGADVMELAKKERILEMAKVMTPPDKFVHIVKEKGEIDVKDLEESRFHIFDTELIMRNLSEMDCPSCEEKGAHDVLMVDFVKNVTKTKCLNCSGESLVNMTPQPKLTKKGRQISKITDLAYSGKIEDVVKYINEFKGPDISLENLLEQSIERPVKLTSEQRSELTDEEFAFVTTIEEKKLRILPIHTLAHINLASARLDETQVIDLIDKLGANIDNVKRKILRRATHLAMKELLEKYQKGTIKEVIQEIAKLSIGRELNEEELEKAYNIVSLKSSNVPMVEKNTSLTEIPEEKSTGNPTSLQNAMTEDQIKASIDEAIRKEDKNVDSKKDTEIATLTVKLEEADAKLKETIATLEETTTKLAKLEEEEAERAKVEKETTIAARKEELGEEVSKDMSDEDILDNMKFKVAKLEKENADLKAGKTVPEKASADLTVGSADQETGAKDASKKVDEIFKASLEKDNEEYNKK